MIGSLIRTILGKCAGYVLDVIGLLYGVVIDDIRRLCHMTEIRKRRNDYLAYQDLMYDVFTSGIPHSDNFGEKMFENDFGRMSEADKKTLEADDELYARMRRILYSQMFIDAMMSFGLTILVLMIVFIGYQFWNCDPFQRLLNIIDG